MTSPDVSFTFSGLFDTAMPSAPYPFGLAGCPCGECGDSDDAPAAGAGASTGAVGTREVFDLAAVADSLIRLATEDLDEQQQAAGRIAAIAGEVVDMHAALEADSRSRVAQHAVQLSINTLALALRAVGACQVEELLGEFERMLTNRLGGVKPSRVVAAAERFRDEVEGLRASAAR